MLNKLLQFFQQNDASAHEAFAEPSPQGRSSACNRLKLVLMHDRTQLEPHVLDKMRDELIGVISKYIEIDREAMNLNLESDMVSNTVALVANIPVSQGRATRVRNGFNEWSAAEEGMASETEMQAHGDVQHTH